MKRKQTDFVIKLSDFGQATHIRQGEKIDGIQGSLNYMAPEVINN